MSNRTKLVIYTVLIGAKEELRNPRVLLPPDATTDLDLDFVCLTDNTALQSPVWRFQIIGDRHLPAEKLSRRPKAMPDAYFPDAAYSLYIDNTVEFLRLPQASDLRLTVDNEGSRDASQPPGRPKVDSPPRGAATVPGHLGAPFRAFRHSTRTDATQEAAVLVTLGYEDVSTVCRQLDFYAAQQPLETATTLTTGTVLLRAHHHPAVKEFGRLWWESILAFSKRDQLSLDYARQQAGIEIDYFDGITRENDFIHWHGAYTQHRVKANFDAKRYAWLHRDDPAAVRDPKAHYLQHGDGDDAAYLFDAPMLDYLCWKHGASLGSQVAPRRHMAGPLEALLQPLQRPGAKHLLVRLRGDTTGPHPFSDDELEAATQALGVLVSPSGSLLVLDLPTPQMLADNKIYAMPQPAFDVVIVLGADGAHLGTVVDKLCHMANRDQATMVLALSGPARLSDAADAERRVATMLGAQASSSSLQGSRHDDVRGVVANTVFALQWAANSVLAPTSTPTDQIIAPAQADHAG
ncbi:MAG: glycosyltransferase domain-containing protein [Burkholderiales bacterium]